MPKPNASHLDDLFAAVVAELDDDTPRAVFADRLQDVGDPRGEYIQLALSGGAPHFQDTLLQAHGEAWLGEHLSRILAPDSITWSRGFPRAAALARTVVAPVRVWKAAASDPRLATFERFSQGAANPERLTSFLLGPGLVNLSDLETSSFNALMRLRSTNIQLRTLRIRGRMSVGRWSQVARLSALEPLTSLHTDLTPATVRSLDRAGLLHRVTELHWVVSDRGPRPNPGDIRALRAKLPRSVELLRYDDGTAVLELD